MIVPREMLGHVTAEPFRPFRIPTASGRTFVARHPEVVQVGRTTLTIFTPLADELPDAKGLWHKLSLMHIESIEPLDAPPSAATKDDMTRQTT